MERAARVSICGGDLNDAVTSLGGSGHNEKTTSTRQQGAATTRHLSHLLGSNERETRTRESPGGAEACAWALQGEATINRAQVSTRPAERRQGGVYNLATAVKVEACVYLHQ